MIEKERKFLIGDKVNIEKYKLKSKLIKQGYLLLGQGGRQLRIRILDKKAYICYKYKISEYEKAEYEYKIPYKEGLELYNSSELKLEKNRFSQKINDEIRIDIDFYKNDYIVVELEYTCSFEKSNEYIKNISKLNKLIGDEITGDKKYSNIQLAKELQ